MEIERDGEREGYIFIEGQRREGGRKNKKQRDAELQWERKREGKRKRKER